MTNEEIVLQIQNGNDRKRHLGLLYTQNIALIRRFIRPLIFSPDDEDDLMQEAYFGMVRAAEKFDTTRGVKFMTYARWFIFIQAQRYMDNHGSVKRIPAHMVERIRKYKKFISDSRMNGKEPSTDEIKEHLEISNSQYDQMLKVIAESEIRSIDAEIADGITLEETIADERRFEDDTESRADLKCVWDEVNKLPKRQAEIIQKQFRHNETIADIAKSKGLSRQRIDVLQKRAFKTLRKSEKLQSLMETYAYDSSSVYRDTYGNFKARGQSNVERIAVERVSITATINNQKAKLKRLMKRIRILAS